MRLYRIRQDREHEHLFGRGRFGSSLGFEVLVGSEDVRLHD